ncbi:MAG: type III-B CRISPR module-associated protein Cmr5 [Bacteroidota bacterium]
MIKQEITQLFPAAIEATKAHLMNDQQQVISEFDGYAASLGASICISGLIPTLAFYTDTKDNKNGNKTQRYRLLKAIAHVCPSIRENIETGEGQKKILLDTVIKAVYPYTDVTSRPTQGNGNDEKLPKIQKPDQQEIRKWTKEIVNASIALKLSMRNFPHTDNDNTPHENSES